MSGTMEDGVRGLWWLLSPLKAINRQKKAEKKEEKKAETKKKAEKKKAANKVKKPTAKDVKSGGGGKASKPDDAQVLLVQDGSDVQAQGGSQAKGPIQTRRHIYSRIYHQSEKEAQKASKSPEDIKVYAKEKAQLAVAHLKTKA